MAESQARAKYLNIAPRKVRLVADLIRGKKVAEARVILDFTVKRAAPLLNGSSFRTCRLITTSRCTRTGSRLAGWSRSATLASVRRQA